MGVKRFSRRDFLRIGIASAAGGAMAACQPQVIRETVEVPVDQTVVVKETVEVPVEVTVEAPPQEGVVIQYWFGWSGTYAEEVWPQLKETEEFAEAIGPHTLETKGGTESNAMLTAVAAGTPPDGASNLPYLDFMARDILWPIDDWAATSSIVTRESFIEGNWDSGFYKGVMYGVPANECFLRYGLNYNAQMVKDAGLDPEQPPVTWQECLEWHNELTQFDDAGNLLQIGLDPYDAMGGSVHTANGFFPAVSWGWDWFDEETGTFNLDNENMIDSFETLGEFYRIIGPDKMAGMRQVEGQGIWGGSYNSRVQAMMIEGYWRPGMTSIQMPEVGQQNVATWVPVPEDRRGIRVQGTGGHFVLFFKEAQNTEPMFRIAEFLNTNRACEVIYANVGWLPAVRSYLSTVDPSPYPGLDFYFRSIDEADEFSSPAQCPITAYVEAQHIELREKVYRDEMTASEAAAEFQKRCENEYQAAGFS